MARFGRSDRSSVTPRSADFVALVVVSQLMWIGGHAALRHGRPDLGLDLVVLGQVVADGDARHLGEAVGDAGLQAVDPAAAPGAHDDLRRLFRLLREGARMPRAERPAAPPSAAAP